MTDAIPVLPSTVIADENGRVTKGAAMALLGKVILTEGGEGWNNDNSRMTEAAGWFAQVRTSGLYSLLPNFPDIFSPDKKFNSESVFEIIHSSEQAAQWGQDPFSGNLYPTLVGPRGYGAGTGPKYSSGWSFNTIIPDFANFMSTDPRYPYTVLNIDGDANGLVTTSGASYVKGYDNTGYFVQKYAPLQQYVSLNGGEGVLNFPYDYIEIRYADVLLMEAEAVLRAGGGAGQAQTNLDLVRARVGLGSVPATLTSVYNERRLELATEGHRWFDLIRTGQAATVLAFKGFQTGKHELLPIPLLELSNTKLKQNPGY
ncbi:MAG: RagB/SusD family nutrient uptake outer membrane protein [Cyclobacteriaceae bacterium]